MVISLYDSIEWFINIYEECLSCLNLNALFEIYLVVDHSIAELPHAQKGKQQLLNPIMESDSLFIQIFQCDPTYVC